MNNSSPISPTTCEIFLNRINDLKATGVFFYGLTLPYFVLTFPTRIVSLAAFYVQAKKESAYRYQTFLTIAELLESVLFTISRASKGLLSGQDGSSRMWFLRCYACMFYDAHIANLSHMSMHLWVLSLTICMTCDRIFALAYPISYYRLTNRHKTIQYAVFALSIAFTFSFSFLIYFHITVAYFDEKMGVYVEGGDGWGAITLMFIFVHTCAKMMCALLIIILNTVLFVLFSYRMRNKGSLRTTMTGEESATSGEVRKVKALFVLTVVQSVSSIIAMSGVFAYNLLVYMYVKYPTLYCPMNASAPFADIVRQVGEIPTFFVMIAFSVSFRKTVRDGVRHMWDKVRRNNQVTDF